MKSEINSQATSGDFEFSALAEARNHKSCLVHEFDPVLRGKVLEIGAGIGQMTAEFAQAPGITELSGWSQIPVSMMASSGTIRASNPSGASPVIFPQNPAHLRSRTPVS
jgi:hypothetical protein